ncbi:hypothetical protein E2C01_029235 [Portunus trituberculatus]|uniref:Uncharacterized protein n=1 Tax=Portunus trituberculatus TaxID=210409 RepID=A0A5B7EMH8_PORTR|nr:hypothetical protein [Portunus trituberculatus]
MSWLLDGEGLELLYKAQVRSSLEFPCLAWGGFANKHLTLLHKVQNGPERLIRDAAGQQPRLRILQHRRDVEGLTVMYKVQVERVSYMQELHLPARYPQVTTHTVTQTLGSSC